MRAEPQFELDSYLNDLLKSLDPWERQCREQAQQLNLDGISLSRAEARLLGWAVAIQPALKAVEIGTLTGLSGLYILENLSPQGTLWTLEKNPDHGKRAESILKDFAKAQNKNVNVVIGDARETLESLSCEGPFDVIFIDGNKAAYLDYLHWSQKNLKVGGVLVADNVLLGGEIGRRSQKEGMIFSDKQIRIMKEFNSELLNSREWATVLIPTSEGLTLSRKI